MKRWMAWIGVITVCLQATGCQNLTDQTKETKNVNPKEEQTAFDTFTDELFVKNVQKDSITLNYTLSEPEDYGITDVTPTLGEFGVKASKQAIAEAENINQRLDEFEYSALTQEQQLTYDILEDYYKLSDDEESFLLYGETLGNTTGIQAQLPILLSEYNIDDKQDVETYLDLLLTVEDYFQQIAEYEREKSDAGLFMPDHNADNIISQCEDFIENPDNNLLITIFEDRIDSFNWLTKKEKNFFKTKNEEAVKNCIIPAYQSLIDTLEELKGTGTYEGGIGNLPKGKEYYEELAKSITGSDKSVSEMKSALTTTMQQAATKLSLMASNDSSLEKDYMSMEFPMTDPDEIMNYLIKAVKEDFPDLGDVNYTVKYVDKSLEDHVSPAFYLTPQLDNYNENSIYINGASDNDLSQIFTTLAHEGYPGHLLQSVYFNQHNKSPIRSLLSYGGYSEGWATYCEMYSYNIAGLEDNLGEFAKQYMIFNLCLYAQIDIGVNYDCWSEDDLAEYLGTYGVTDKDAVSQIFDIVVDDPANYLQYVVGYIEFMELRDEAEDTLGDNFNAKEFHTFLLDTGDAPFYIIEKYMQDWMEEQK